MKFLKSSTNFNAQILSLPMQRAGISCTWHIYAGYLTRRWDPQWYILYTTYMSSTGYTKSYATITGEKYIYIWNKVGNRFLVAILTRNLLRTKLGAFLLH